MYNLLVEIHLHVLLKYTFRLIDITIQETLTGSSVNWTHYDLVGGKSLFCKSPQCLYSTQRSMIYVKLRTSVYNVCAILGAKAYQ